MPFPQNGLHIVIIYIILIIIEQIYKLIDLVFYIAVTCSLGPNVQSGRIAGTERT